MKKTITILLVLALALGMLTACGSTEIRSYSDDATYFSSEDIIRLSMVCPCPSKTPVKV